MRQRIVIIPAWYPTPQNPVGGLFIRDQAACLAPRFDVTVLLPRLVSLRRAARGQVGPRLSPTEEEGVRVWSIRQLALPTPPDCVRRLLDRPTGVIRMERRLHARSIRWGLERYVRQFGRPDLIHAHVVLPSGWIAMRLGRRWDAPVVLTEHSGPFAVHLKTGAQRELVRATLRGVDRVLAVSPALAQTLRDFCPDAPIGVLGNVVRTDFFVPSAPRPHAGPARRYFLLALLTPEKGVQHLLEALVLLRRQGVTGLEVVIGGDGPYRPQIERRIAELALGDQCRLTGMLDREGARRWMQWCDVFVLPSLGETFGLSICEAMACGKPVLTTRCGGPEFTVTKNTGILVAPGHPAELAAAMADLAAGRYTFDAANIRRSVGTRFGPEAFVEAVSRVYAEVWAGRNRGLAPGAARRT